MAFQRWELYAASLYVEFEAHPGYDRSDYFRDFGTFKAFVEETPLAERVPLLLFAYERHLAPEPPNDSDGQKFFWRAAYRLLIGHLLGARLEPTEAEACHILHYSSGIDSPQYPPLPPIDLAEKAFRHKPYSEDLFAAVRTYRAALGLVKSTRASTARGRLDLMLWHDVERHSRGCWTARIQRAMAAMKPEEAFQWQWILRNFSRGLWNSGGRQWAEEGRRRLAELGEDRFLERLDEWFVFAPGERLRLSKPGSQMLCLLVLYAGLTGASRSLPILRRLASVAWSQRERMQRVVEALARIR